MSLGMLPRAALLYVIFSTKYRHRILVCGENDVKEGRSHSDKSVCLTLPLILKKILKPMSFFVVGSCSLWIRSRVEGDSFTVFMEVKQPT